VRLEPLYVEQILGTPSCALVADQVGSRQDGYDLIGEWSLNSFRPSVIERNAVNGRDHVDAYRGDPDLKDCARRREIAFRKIMQWGTECRERGENSRSIAFGGADPDVEVLGRAHVPMRCERVSADNEVFNASSVELG
jgi:hypothetical protein